MSKDKQDSRRDKYVLSSNEGITIVLPDSAYELLRGGDSGGNKDDDSKSSGSGK